MGINMYEVKLFASTGRLIKSINRSELPEKLPEIISYAGNFYGQGWRTNEYTERSAYVYAEKRVTEQDPPTLRDTGEIDPPTLR